MKTVTFIRHAKSSWKDSSLDDIDRPLNKRGRTSAPDMGARLFERGVQFEKVYSSPAKRAYTTAKMVAAPLGYPVEEIEIVDELYTFSYAGTLSWLHGLDSNESNFAVVGHNPATTELVNYLALSDIDNIPTCGIVQLKVKVDSWLELDVGIANIEFYIYPKQKG